MMQKKVCFGGLIPALIFFILMAMFAIAVNAAPITNTKAWPPKNFRAYGDNGLTGKKLAVYFKDNAKTNKARLAKKHRNFSKKYHRGITGGVIKKCFKK